MSKNNISRRSFFKRIPGLVVAPKVLKDLLTETPVEPPEDDAPEFDSSACGVFSFDSELTEISSMRTLAGSSSAMYPGFWNIKASDDPALPGDLQIRWSNNTNDD